MPKRKTPGAEPPIVSLVNLGCAKNLVDSERILGALAESGFLIAQDPGIAEVCLVNTCGFIDEARRETAEVLRELHELKAGGRLKTVVALGCLVERAADASELGRFLQHADARLGFKDYPDLPKIVRELVEAGGDAARYAEAARSYAEGPAQSAAKKKVPKSYNDFLVAPRLRIGPRHHAFLKISEGCNNPCRFCSIPRMRGLQVSRPVEELVEEARRLAGDGVQELSLIAQDTTSYGKDLYGEYRLAALLEALKAVEGPRWFRLMYAYPRFLTAEMLDVLASDPRFCPYIDMPLQHVADRLLESMKRMVTKDETLAILDLIERKLPGAALRTTFIVGYPDETEADFLELLDFVKQGRFTHAGVFLYSNEPLTPAAREPDRVPLEEKLRRREALMLAQREVSRARMARRVGERVEVLLDGPPPAGQDVPAGVKAVGRTSREALEVDGVVYLKGRGVARKPPGSWIPARIVESLEYDLVAEPAK
ncbi:MAG: 30S ribosomal protein S12 methylthiotransferase RimO [Planctomycetota bacterium]|nr:30S ribosomal protein S12 methylthiotransferase RimO [Planctomycetota bacterium]